MVDEQRPRPLTAVDFTPLDASASRRRLRVSPVYLGLGIVLALAALSLTYLLAARAVIFRVEPGHAELAVSGISFHIGDNFLLLRGRHQVIAEAEGYYPLTTAVDVTGDRTQEVALELEPLPGKLQVESELDDVEVFIDDEPAGSAPGLIENVPRGSHIVEFRKYRYFPLRQELEVEGLGRTQSLTVDLEPAWGQMQITSVPDGADVVVDGRQVGTTPLTTEVLETGTRLTLAKPGYKTWEREVSIEAGTTGTYPPVELEVADGIVEVSSSPAGAHVSVDGEFRGTTPVSVEISPLREHRIELFLEGYRNAVRTIRTEPEGRSSLALDMVPIIGRIQLSITPDDAEVVVNQDLMTRGAQLNERMAANEARPSGDQNPHPGCPPCCRPMANCQPSRGLATRISVQGQAAGHACGSG